MTERARFSVAKSRIVTGIITFIAFGVYLWQGYTLPRGQMNAPGPGLFPLFVSGVAFVAGIVTVYDGIRLLREDTTYKLPLGVPLRRCALIFVALVFLAATLPFLGRIITPFVTILIILLTLSDRGWIHSLVWSALLTALVFVVFVELLGVPLPRGVFLNF